MMKKEDLGKLKSLNQNVVLATVSAKNYQKTNNKLIKYLTQKVNIPGVYVTLNKPYETVSNIFNKEKIDTRLIIFIDAITKTTHEKIKKTKNCLFIGTPENLSDISISMDQAVTSLPGKEKFLFFDSLSTLLIYNDVTTVARFIHFLSGKMRAWKVTGIIISLQKKGNEDLINELLQFCDIRLDFK